RHEAFPLPRNAVVSLESVSFTEARNQQDATVFETRWLQIGDQRLVHSDRLHESKVVNVALRAHDLRRQAALIAEGTGEGFVRAIAGIECYHQYVRRAGGEPTCGLRQTASAYMAHHRLPGRNAERTQQVIA